MLESQAKQNLVLVMCHLTLPGMSTDYMAQSTKGLIKNTENVCVRASENMQLKETWSEHSWFLCCF